VIAGTYGKAIDQPSGAARPLHPIEPSQAGCFGFNLAITSPAPADKKSR